MEKLTALYAEHIKTLQYRTQQVLQRSKLDAILIHSGEPLRIFLDDSDYPLKLILILSLGYLLLMSHILGYSLMG